MDTSLQEKYAEEVRNRFEVLGIKEESATDRYDRFIKAIKEGAEKIVPLRNRAKKTCFSSDPRVTKARDEITDACAIYQQNITDGNRVSTRKRRIGYRKCTNTSLRKT